MEESAREELKKRGSNVMIFVFHVLSLVSQSLESPVKMFCSGISRVLMASVIRVISYH